jgi:sulfite exporter TauE/SafE
MVGVGLGTAPGLLGVGLFGTGIFGAERRFARVGMRAAGVVVVTIALLTIGRASGIISDASPVNHVLPTCCGGGHH